MTKLQEIEAAIAQLAPDDFAKLADWFDRKRETAFDRQLATDAASGRLDALWETAEKEIAQGKAKPLDELLDD